MTPPLLNDAWSIAYLQVLIILLIFAIGIPSIIFQVTLPEEIQDIVNRYMRKYFFFPFATVILLLIVSISFIWVWHPNAFILVLCRDWVGASIVSLSLFFLIIAWLNYLRKLSRENIVEYLKNLIMKTFGKNGSLPSFFPPMDDLITLGEHSDAGYKKKVVLIELANLSQEIQDSQSYSGNDLELMLRNFDKVVTGKGKPGNESDFLRAVEILEKIIERLPNKKKENEGDEIWVYGALTEIGKKAAELQFSEVTQKISFIAAANSDALFKIGLATFNSGDYLAATNTLGKLKTLALETLGNVNQSANNFFGLLAYFWNGNRSSRRCAEKFLNSVENKFSSLERYLDQAIEDNFTALRFDTADKLIIMKDDIVKSRKSS